MTDSSFWNPVPASDSSSTLLVHRVRTSTWIIVGYSFWFGFFLGALIMHSIVKSI